MQCNKTLPVLLVLMACAVPALAEEPGLSTSLGGIGEHVGDVEVEECTLTNTSGIEVRVLTLGAMITSVKTPDRNGKLDGITLFRENPGEYLKKRGVLGTVIGRFANRIAGAQFTLDGKEYCLTANSQGNHIHGGPTGFHTQVWDVEYLEKEEDSVALCLSLTSPDGQEGYPGTLRVTVVYRLTDRNELWMEYTATTDRPTHVNLTNHAYWNLKGEGDVLGHALKLNADHYLPTDEKKIPIGPPAPVEGTAMDFTDWRTIGSRIERVEGKNYDHCYVINRGEEQKMVLAASVEEPTSGRVMEVFTTQPGVQLYTARGNEILSWRSSLRRVSGALSGNAAFSKRSERTEFPVHGAPSR